jgi:predicted RNase H-like HicB family nuclease
MAGGSGKRARGHGARGGEAEALDLAEAWHLGHCFHMNLPISAEIHRDGDWFVAFCPEVPEANGQGRTEDECLDSLRQAILLLMEDRREDARHRLKDEATLLELA